MRALITAGDSRSTRARAHTHGHTTWICMRACKDMHAIAIRSSLGHRHCVNERHLKLACSAGGRLLPKPGLCCNKAQNLGCHALHMGCHALHKGELGTSCLSTMMMTRKLVTSVYVWP
eukprot:1159069-Pelagomonas_calceolata.AAC.10